MAAIEPNSCPIFPPTKTNPTPIEIISETRVVMRACAVWIIDGLIGFHQSQLFELEQKRAEILAQERRQQS